MPSPDAPNVLLLIVDDLRPDLGSYGHPLVQSPNIDRLAARGVLFERAYAQFPVCNPSRISLLTGLRPSATRVLDNTTHYREHLPQALTLPQLFRENGYFTASVGKIFHGAGGKKRWSNPEAWDVTVFPRRHRRAPGRAGRKFNFAEGSTIGWIAAGGADEDQPDGQAALETVGLLEQASRQAGPFFIATGFLRPHAPMIAPESYFDRYPLADLEPFLAVPGHPGQNLALTVGKPRIDEIDREGQLELLRAYYACTSYVDAQVGKIFEALDRLDLWRNTVVVFTSDHGLHLGERGWWSKNTLSEIAARVPLIVSVPGPNRGATTRALVELIDVYPTLVELGSLADAPEVDGRSFVPVLDNPVMEWKPAAFTQVVRPGLEGHSVRTERWRYTEWDGGEAGIELYDHELDPLELIDLASDPGHAETVERLEEILQTNFPDGGG